MSETLIEKLRYRIDRKRESAQTKLEEWREKIAAAGEWQVAHELSWSEDAFQEAALVEVFSRIAASIEPEKLADVDAEERFAHVERYCAEEVNRGARWPRHSTSESSNLIERYRLAAWGEAQEIVMNLRTYGETL